MTEYMFKVELLAQEYITMHGSDEGHTCYVYVHSNVGRDPPRNVRCNDLFKEAWKHVRQGGNHVVEYEGREYMIICNEHREKRRKSKIISFKETRNMRKRGTLKLDPFQQVWNQCIIEFFDDCLTTMDVEKQPESRKATNSYKGDHQNAAVYGRISFEATEVSF
jgi:hypothetical protein